MAEQIFIFLWEHLLVSSAFKQKHAVWSRNCCSSNNLFDSMDTHGEQLRAKPSHKPARTSLPSSVISPLQCFLQCLIATERSRGGNYRAVKQAEPTPNWLDGTRINVNLHVLSCHFSACQVNVCVVLPVLFSSGRCSSIAGDGAGAGIPFCLQRPSLHIQNSPN